MNDEQKRLIFEQEYERERARDTYRSDKKKSEAKKNRWLENIINIFTGILLVYIFFVFKSFGFEIHIIDKQFIAAILVIFIAFGLICKFGPEE